MKWSALVLASTALACHLPAPALRTDGEAVNPLYASPATEQVQRERGIAFMLAVLDTWWEVNVDHPRLPPPLWFEVWPQEEQSHIYSGHPLVKEDFRSLVRAWNAHTEIAAEFRFRLLDRPITKEQWKENRRSSRIDQIRGSPGSKDVLVYLSRNSGDGSSTHWILTMRWNGRSWYGASADCMAISCGINLWAEQERRKEQGLPMGIFAD